MSTLIMSACWPLQGMSPAQKAVLISLADNANDNGVCWPSIPTIGFRCCLSERAVQNAIKWLEQVGLVLANRNNGRHTSYTVTPAGYAPPQDMRQRTKCTGAADAPTPAADAGDPRRKCTTPPQQVPSNRKEPSKEPSVNRQPPRRSPRIALHAEILDLDLPACIPFDVWDLWCEHREAKATKGAPWTRGAARVSIKKLEMLNAQGQIPLVTVEEAVLRGWTGLFVVKTETGASASVPGAAPSDWYKTAQGIIDRGQQLGITQGATENFPRFRARVYKAAGPGEWIEELLRATAKEGESSYDALFAYFNSVPASEARP